MSDNQDAAPNYQEEIEAALNNDSKRLGDFFRATRDNKSMQEIADEWETTVSTVRDVRQSVDTLLECSRRISEGTGTASRRAGMVRAFSRKHGGNLSPETRQNLSELIDEHEAFVNNEEVINQENEEIELKEREWNQVNVPGVYVYTYLHYMRYPVRPSYDTDTSPRTFLKIGKSDSDMAERIARQNRTSMPEPPLVLRMYGVPPNGNAVEEIEKTIHSHLNAADHNRNTQKGAGKEWFLTHLPFVDSTASLLGLEELYRHAEDE